MRRVFQSDVWVTTNPEGPWKHTRPKRVRFGQHTIEGRRLTWSDVLRRMCELIAKENPEDFHLVEKRIMGWAERPYFGRECDREDHNRPYQVPGTEIFVRPNLSANNTAELCKGLCILFGYGAPALEVDLR
jgi:hypothetical protein